ILLCSSDHRRRLQWRKRFGGHSEMPRHSLSRDQHLQNPDATPPSEKTHIFNPGLIELNLPPTHSGFIRTCTEGCCRWERSMRGLGEILRVYRYHHFTLPAPSLSFPPARRLILSTFQPSIPPP